MALSQDGFLHRLLLLNRRVGKMVGAVAFVVFASVVIVQATRVIYSGLHELVAYEQATGCVVRYQSPDDVNDRHGSKVGRLTYTYTVGSKELEGVCPTDYGHGMPRAPYAVLQHPWRHGDEVPVFYDPAKPDQSTLEPRVEPFVFPFITFVLPFGIVGFGTLFFPSWRRGSDDGVLACESQGKSLIVVYFIASCVLCFSLFFLMEVVSWQIASLLGALVPVVIVPGILLFTLRWTRRSAAANEPGRRRLKPEAEKAVRRQVIVVACVCLFWWGIVSVFLVYTGSFWVTYLHARATYETTRGIMVPVAETKDHAGYDRLRAGVTVAYEYEVGDRSYVADRVVFESDSQGGYHGQLLREGGSVEVFYDPGLPENAVLDWSVPSIQRFMPILLTPFVVLGVVLVVKLVRVIRYRDIEGRHPQDRASSCERARS